MSIVIFHGDDLSAVVARARRDRALPTGLATIRRETCDLRGNAPDLDVLERIVRDRDLFATQRQLWIWLSARDRRRWEQVARCLAWRDDATEVTIVVEGTLPDNHPARALATSIVHVEPLTEKTAPAYVQRLARDARLSLAAPVAAEVARRVGPDPIALENAVQQLAAFVDDGARVTVADVRAVVPDDHHGQAAFALHNALTTGDRTEVRAVIAAQLARGDSPLQLLATLQTVVRQIALVTSAWRGGQSRVTDVVTATGLHPFVVQKILPLARRCSETTIVRALTVLVTADFLLKIGRSEPLLLSHAAETLLDLLHGRQIPGPGRPRDAAPPAVRPRANSVPTDGGLP